MSSYAQKNLKKELLCHAYRSLSPKATFWWLENSPIKFTSGSNEGLRVLYAEYCHLSLTESIFAINKRDISYTPTYAEFFNRILPDINYSEIGFKDKEDCIHAIAESYIQLIRDKNFEDKLKQHSKCNVAICSPFFTYEFWLALKYEQIKTENDKITKEALHEMYEEWIDDFLEYVKEIQSAYNINIRYYYEKYYDPDKENIVII